MNYSRNKARAKASNDEANDLQAERPGKGAGRQGVISEFLWICAGVDREKLRRCPSDYAKYAGIGGTILFTSLMAMLSGGYAISTVFNDYESGSDHIYIGVLFGVFWGLLIFNLDRFMVNTMYSDGTAKITKEEVMSGLPRLVLAVFLGIVISAPLELRVFKDKIDAQIEIDKGLAASDIDQSNSDNHKEILRLEDQKRMNDAMVEKARAEFDKAQRSLYDETAGKVGSGVKGDGPAARRLKELVEQRKQAYEHARAKADRDNAFLNTQLEQLYAKKDNIAESRDAAVNSMQGFTARLKAMNAITSDDASLCLVRLLITLLFVAIEIIPTIFKMMMENGAYDDLMRAERHRVKVLSDKMISDVNDEVCTSVSISTAQNQKRIEEEVKANNEVVAALASAQSDILKEAIRLWKESEMEKVKNNPGQYLNVENAVVDEQGAESCAGRE